MNKKTKPLLPIVFIVLSLIFFGLFVYSFNSSQNNEGGQGSDSTENGPKAFVESMFKGIDRAPELEDPIKKQEKDPDKESGQTLVTVDNQTDLNSFLENNDLREADISPSNGLPNTYIVKKPKSELNTDGASLAERKKYSSLYTFTNQDTIYPQWYTTKINADQAWDVTTGSVDTKVAIIDTGFALAHEDLAGRWAANGKDFANNDDDPQAGTTSPNSSSASHGTMVAGLVGATGDNGKGVASVNWQTKILPLQALNDEGDGWTDDVAAAVDYAVAQGADVINMSLGSSGQDPLLKTAVDSAIASGVTVVAAAGNCGGTNYAFQGCAYRGEILYPAKYGDVIAVGATDSNDSRATFSSYGPEIDLVAPGSGAIRSTMWTQENSASAYNSILSGTSFSSPIVAGTAALQKGFNPELMPADIQKILTDSASKVAGMSGSSFSQSYGYGRLDNFAAIKQSKWPGNNTSFRLIECDSKKYFIERNIRKKRLLSDEAINAWGLEDALFSLGDKGCSYQAYRLVLGRQVKSRNTLRVYLVDSIKAYKLQSATIARAWGMVEAYSSSKSGLPQMNGKTLHELKSIAKFLPRVVSSDADSKSYLLDSGKKHYLSGSPDDDVSLQLLVGDDKLPVGGFSESLLGELGIGLDINYSVKVGGNYYLIDYGQIHRIDNNVVANWLGLVGDSPIISTDFLPRIANSEAIVNGFFESGSYYYFDEDGLLQSTNILEEALSLGIADAPELSSLLKTKIVE